MKFRIDIWVKAEGLKWRKAYAYEIKPELHHDGSMMDPNRLLFVVKDAVLEAYPFKERRT